MTDIIIENKKCHIHNVDTGGPVIFWGITDRGDDSLTSVISYLEEAALPCTLFAFEVEDWNGDFSPWKMHTEDFDFAGNGIATLNWLKNTAFPYAAIAFPKTDKYIIAGYSLSGLFALWAFYETQLFNGTACCSASLWFDGWDAYAKDKAAPKDSIVYLSLGGKEHNSPNAIMATIGEKYKLQEKICKADANIAKTIFEQNPSGHFANPPKRIAKGIIRILKELQG